MVGHFGIANFNLIGMENNKDINMSYLILKIYKFFLEDLNGT